MPLSSPFFSQIQKSFVLCCLFSLLGCQSPPITEETNNQNPENLRSNTELTLTNATLEQSDIQGETVWKINAKTVIYNEEQSQANLKDVVGNIFQDDQLILKIKADQGYIENNGDRFFLQDNIVATDQRNQGVITGDQAEWDPTEDVLLMKDNIQGNYEKNWQITATAGRYFVKEEKLELFQDIVGKVTQPLLQWQTEHLWWHFDDNKLIVDQPLQITEYEEKKPKSKVTAEKGEFDLETEIAFLEKNIQFQQLTPPLKVRTNLATWNFKTEIIDSPKTLQIIHAPSQVNMTGNQGQLNLNSNQVRLWQGVQGINQKHKSQLYAQEVNWNLTTQQVEALGEVVYQQTNPQFTLTGVKATGKINDNTLVVVGSETRRVSTEIIPD